MNERRYDLDWLRIIAFGLLILYHVGMFYVSWDWHVKSSRASEAVEPFMLLTSPWRMSLLFLISGAATRFMADRMEPGELAASRMRRLWPPLLLAIFVIVPPQSYYEVLEALHQVPAPGTFYLHYVTGTGHWCDQDGCLITPTYNHMWFVAYLIVYTLALAALLPLLRSVGRRWSHRLVLPIAGPGLVITPWALMFLLRITLEPRFGESHVIWADGYLHPLYFSTFLFGFAIARHEPFFQRCASLRWGVLLTALAAWGARAMYFYARPDQAPAPGEGLRMLLLGLRELQAWTAILAALGFAHHHLRHGDGPVRRVLTQAIFPCYLIHQTVIVVAAHYLDPLHLPMALEALLLVGITILGCWLFFDLGRRITWLRRWIGLPPGRIPPRQPALPDAE